MTDDRTSLVRLAAVVSVMSACGLWLLSAPVDPDLLFAALPPNAQLAAIHDNLGDRLPEIAASPLIRALLRSMGVDSNRIAAVLNSPWPRRLAGQRTIIVSVPADRHHPPPLLILTACGGWSQRLRWLASLGRLPVAPAGYCEGTALWRLDDPSLDRPLYFAAEEGILAACLSDDTRILKEALTRYHSSRPHLRTILASVPPAVDPGRDHGWIRLPRIRILWRSLCLTPRCSSLEFILPHLPSAGTAGNPRLAGNPPPLRPGTAAVIRVPAQLLSGLASNLTPPFSSLCAAVAAVAAHLPENAVDLVLLHRSPHADPSLSSPMLPVVSWPLASGTDPVNAMQCGLDRFNRDTGWNLILHQTTDRNTAWVVESALEDSAFDHLPSWLQPVFLVSRSRLFLAPRAADRQWLLTVAGALEAAANAPPETADKKWLIAAATLNLPELADPLRRLVSLYVLKNLLDSRKKPSRSDLRRLLRFATLWSEGMKEAGAAQLCLYARAGGSAVISLKLGPCATGKTN